jgi:hypothetical protein
MLLSLPQLSLEDHDETRLKANVVDSNPEPTHNVAAVRSRKTSNVACRDHTIDRAELNNTLRALTRKLLEEEEGRSISAFSQRAPSKRNT